MRSEIKEAVRSIHSEEYRRLLAGEQRLAKARRTELVRRVTSGVAAKAAPTTRRIRNVLIACGALVVALFLWGGAYYYNMFVAATAELERTASMVESETNRRANLIPNLMVISAEYSTHEATLFKYVSEMRSTLSNPAASSGEVAASLSKLMSSLVAVAEQYPDLKANQSFEQLMKDWTVTEDRIADSREAYIQAIKTYNHEVRSFPSDIYGFLYGMKRHTPYTFTGPGPSTVDLGRFYQAYREGKMGTGPVNDPADAEASGSANLPAVPAVSGKITGNEMLRSGVKLPDESLGK